MREKNLIFGLHAVQSIVQRQPERVQQVYLLDGRKDQKLQQLMKSLAKLQISTQTVSRDFLDRLSEQGNHQGVIAQCAQARAYTEADLKEFLEELEEPPLLLILDGVQDPHNLGACLRTADAAGVHAVIAPKDRSVGLTATVSKVACGAAENIPFVQVTNLARTLGWLKEQGIWLFGMADQAEKSLYQEGFKTPTAFVMGGEEKGMRQLTREHCDVLLRIPMQGSVSSLNVSVASALCLYEALRQRLTA